MRNGTRKYAKTHGSVVRMPVEVIDVVDSVENLEVEEPARLMSLLLAETVVALITEDELDAIRYICSIMVLQ